MLRARQSFLQAARLNFSSTATNFRQESNDTTINDTAATNATDHNLKTESDRSKPFAAIPGPKPLPLIGNIWRYLPFIGQYKPDTLVENALYNRRRYGPIVREAITSKLTILHLNDPNDIEALFRQDGKYPERRSHRALLKYRRDRPHLYSDGGLFPENGPKWHRQRNQFQNRLMSKSYVALQAQKLMQISDKMIARIPPDGQVDKFDVFLHRWALASSLKVFLDVDFDSIEPNVTDKLVNELHNSLAAIDKTEIQTNTWLEKPHKCPHFQKLVGAEQFLRQFVDSRVGELLKSHSKTNESDPTFLRDWLLEDKIDRKDVVLFLVDVLLAGLHTTSYVTAFLLYHLSHDQATQDSLRAELNSASNDQEMMAGSNLLRDCLREAMRLNPASIGTGRVANSDSLVIRGYRVPKGTMIITQNEVICRDSNHFNDPDKFLVARWANYRAAARCKRPSPFASLPFGFGARACIGQRVAELQIKLFTARLLREFEIEPIDDIPVKTMMVHVLGGHFPVSLQRL